MIEPSEISAGDRVTLRGSDPPKVGRVLTILNRSADWLPADFPAGQIPDVLAVVAWQGETTPVAERPADLIKLLTAGRPPGQPAWWPPHTRGSSHHPPGARQPRVF